MSFQPASQPVPRTLATIDGETNQLALSATDLAHRSATYTCPDRDAFRAGGEDLRTIAGMLKKLEDKRTSVTGPLNDALRNINAWFTAPREALQGAKKKIGERMAQFEKAERDRETKAQAEAEQKARENREELQRRAAIAAAKGNEAKAQELATRATEVVAAKVDIVAPKAAGVNTFGDVWEFEVIDKNKLPSQYLQADLVKIGQMVRALKDKEHAEAQIPGIRVTSRPRIAVRS